MKIKNPLMKIITSKEDIITDLLLVFLVANSIFIGCLIGIENREENSTILLIPVDVESIDSLWFVDLFVLVLPYEQNHLTSASYENKTLYISTINATILEVELVITVCFYYFRIIDTFYNYYCFRTRSNITSFTLCELDFWYLIYVEPSDINNSGG